MVEMRIILACAKQIFACATFCGVVVAHAAEAPAALEVVLIAGGLAPAARLDDASAIADRWAVAYSANDPAELIKLYTTDAIMFGVVEPMIFDGSEPISAQFLGLPGSGNKVHICERRVLPPLREDPVLITGSYQFEVTKDGVRALLPSHFTMLVVKHDADWEISYHTSSPLQPIDESSAGKGGRQSSFVPTVPTECR
jgi:hypothetical protein